MPERYVMVLSEVERDGVVNGTYHAGLDDLSATVIRNAVPENEAVERMVAALEPIIRDATGMPYMAHVADFTDAEIQRGLLTKADEDADRRNAEFVHSLVVAALDALPDETTLTTEEG